MKEQNSVGTKKKSTTKSNKTSSAKVVTKSVEQNNDTEKTVKNVDVEKPAKVSSVKKQASLNVGENKGDSETVIIEEGVVYKAPRIIVDKEKPQKTKKKDKKDKKDNVVRFNPNTKVGLTSSQVEHRVNEGLTNHTENKNVKSYSQIFLSNIFTFFNILCFGIAIALIVVKAPISMLIFLVTVSANLVIGIIQEIRAKKTIEKISLVVSPSAIVIRDKQEVDIPVSDIVLDDIILLSSGKQIPADCIVAEGEIEVNESLLTGESVAVKKKKGDLLYSGSFVVGGKCYARVDKVGDECYTAKLAAKAKRYQKPKSELLNSLNTIIKVIGIIIIPLAVLTFMSTYKAEGSISAAIKYTAGSAIGMIPAGMFLLTSVALAVGVIKLATKRTLVQDLYSIEMLARADVLCLDKTGTITDGTMKVYSVVQIGNNLNDNIGDVMGSMLTALDDNNLTSRALATHFGYSKEYTAKTILPFNSSRKLSGVTFKNGVTYAYGAPEFVMKGKSNAETDRIVKQYAQKGFRVLLLVKCDGEITNDTLPAKRTPVAVIVIEDHIREDAPKTIQWFKDNGVQIKIISGDNPLTVSEVSKRVGVERAEMYISLEGLSENQVIEAADKYTVFGRVSPEQKSILVKALKAKGHKVAMTGDGVNDILAMKEADCSIAMASGSEATRNVSHLVLLDSNFSSMPSVVSEGRRVVNNVQNTSSLFLMKTIFTILLTIFFLFIPNQSYPFYTSHILLLEFFIIGLPSFFLALQPNDDVIKGKFLSNLLAKSLPSALIFTLDAIACYVFDLIVGTNGEYVTMMALTVTFAGLMVLFTLCKPYNLYRGILVSAVTILLSATLIIIPFDFFMYTPLSLQNVLFVIILILLSYPTYNTFMTWFEKLRNRQNKRM